MDACCLDVDFSLQGVAISLLMDLVGLTQSVAMVTAESEGPPGGGGPESAQQPMSPSQGRVAVVIRPPLTQGLLKYMADKTDFFKVTKFLWENNKAPSAIQNYLGHSQAKISIFLEYHRHLY